MGEVLHFRGCQTLNAPLWALRPESDRLIFDQKCANFPRAGWRWRLCSRMVRHALRLAVQVELDVGEVERVETQLELAAGVAAYALSPIDLIPDFIPVLGYLDDLILVPLGVVVALKLIPPAVMAECRLKAEARLGLADRPSQ
jgi:uncharacterized membrane protein YkvA (DUF1232 family)